MRKYAVEIEQVETKKLQEVTCGRCQKVISDKVPECPDMISGCHVTLDYGYCSIHDGSKYELDLCDECLDEFLDSFKEEPIDLRAYDWCGVL